MKLSLDHFSAQDLVVIGVFAAASKVTTLLVALAGGGMNPISLMGKNLIFTMLLVVMLCRVNKIGTLFLFTVINILVSMLLLGASVALLPPMLFAACAAECVMYIYRNSNGIFYKILGVALFDSISKILSLGISYLMMRENISLMMMVIPFVALGYIGSLGGLYTGVKAVKELRHAGIIRS